MAAFKGQAAFTPANTSHTAGDVVGVKTSFGQIDHNTDWIITGASMLHAGGTVETATHVVHLYDGIPTTIADDAVYALADADRAKYLGSFTLAQMVDLGGSCYIERTDMNKQIKVNSGTLYGFLVTATTVTTAAEARTVTIYARTVD